MTTHSEIARITRERDEAREEVERLRKELETSHSNGWFKDKVVKDAARYRWLRDQKHEVRMWLPNGEYKFYQPTSLTNEEIDAAIDAAINNQEKQND